MCSVSDVPVGCDVERIQPIELDIARRYFFGSEYESIASVTDDERYDRFYRFWTLKESFVKLKGDGLSRPLDSFSFKESCGKIVLVCDDDDRDYHFINRFTDDDYCYSVAFEGDFKEPEAEFIDPVKIRNYLYEA